MRLPRGKQAVLLVGVPVGLAVAGVLVYTQLVAGSPAPEVPDPGPGQHGPMLALEDRVVNLPVSSPFRYVKIAVTIELRPDSAAFYGLTGDARASAEKELLKNEDPAVPLLQDAVGSVVVAQDGASLATTEGRARLKAELLAAARRILGERAVLNVYLTDLVMQ
jgi:flagellar basal body-associated protein FliL